MDRVRGGEDVGAKFEIHEKLEYLAWGCVSRAVGVDVWCGAPQHTLYERLWDVGEGTGEIFDDVLFFWG